MVCTLRTVVRPLLPGVQSRTPDLTTHKIDMSTKTNTKYWIVGASFEGDPQDKRFVEQGFWMLGWEEGNQPLKAAEIEPGDRIAIKRLRGKAQKGIRIMHIGVVKGVIKDTNKVICTVDWAAKDLDRVIAESGGCFASVHGPYTKADNPTTKQWIEEIFSL